MTSAATDETMEPHVTKVNSRLANLSVWPRQELRRDLPAVDEEAAGHHRHLRDDLHPGIRRFRQNSG